MPNARLAPSAGNHTHNRFPKAAHAKKKKGEKMLLLDTARLISVQMSLVMEENDWMACSNTHTYTHTPLFGPLVPATVTVGGLWPLRSLRMVKANPTGMLQECES